MKKTAPIAELLEKANHMLEHSAPELAQGREAIATFISGILSDSGNYKGFGYLDLSADNSRLYGKECRVFFYVAENLKQDYRKFEEARKDA